MLVSGGAVVMWKRVRVLIGRGGRGVGGDRKQNVGARVRPDDLKAQGGDLDAAAQHATPLPALRVAAVPFTAGLAAVARSSGALGDGVLAAALLISGARTATFAWTPRQRGGGGSDLGCGGSGGGHVSRMALIPGLVTAAFLEVVLGLSVRR